MKLYNVQRSPNCKKIRVCANELGLSLDIIPVDPRKGDNRLPDYLGKNPMGKVPTVDDGGFVLWESNAILVYLCSKVAGQSLFPSDAKGQAETLRWLFWGSSHFATWTGVVSFERVLKPLLGQGEPDNSAIGLALGQLARFIPVLESQLSQNEYITGAYSIADISIGCIAAWSLQIGLDLQPYPRIRAWTENLMARDAWKRAE